MMLLDGMNRRIAQVLLLLCYFISFKLTAANYIEPSYIVNANRIFHLAIDYSPISCGYFDSKIPCQIDQLNTDYNAKTHQIGLIYDGVLNYTTERVLEIVFKVGNLTDYVINDDSFGVEMQRQVLSQKEDVTNMQVPMPSAIILFGVSIVGFAVFSSRRKV